ncbi:MAG TPA: FecR family protein [Bacillota bacterium]|nr:FecR family protein [Bacillota bacterium]
MGVNLKKIGLCLLLTLTLSVWIPILTYAENSLSITALKTELEPQEKVTVTVQILDENQKAVDVSGQLSVKVSRGGIVDSNILKSGLALKNGAATFVFIAPGKPGVSDILIIDPSTNLSGKLSLKIIENPGLETAWNPQYAQISKVKGKVAVKYNGKQTWDSALANAQLHEKDTVMTWDKSWVTLKLFDGSVLTVEPGTTLYIKSLKSSNKIKQSIFKVFTGKVLAKVSEYLEKGSRFEIESESATAGVKGTYFEFGVTLDGFSELFVYDGTVLIEELQQELSFLLEKGQSILIDLGNQMPNTNTHTITPDAKDKEIDSALTETETETGTVTPTPPANTPTETPDQSNNQGQQPSNLNTDLFYGSQQVNGQTYLTLHVQPEFKKIFGSPFGVGLDLVLYQNPDTGDMSLSSPDPDGKVGNFINWLEYDGKNTYVFYGPLAGISYDFGLLFSGYHKDRALGPLTEEYNNDRARGIQFGLKNLFDDKVSFKVLAPFEVKTISPWEWDQTSSLFALRGGYKMNLLALPGELGLTLVGETKEDLADPVPVGNPADNTVAKVPTGGAAVDLSLQLTELLQPYTELAALKDFGAGLELGVRGKLSVIQYQTGFRFLGEKFLPNYFGDDYEIYKDNTIREIYGRIDTATGKLVDVNGRPITGRQLPDLNSIPATSGYYAKLGFNIGSFVQLQMGYENYTNIPEQSPVLSMIFQANTPNLGFMPAMSGGLSYKQIQFNTDNSAVNPWLNANTLLAWYLKYPMSSGLYITVTNTFIPSDDKVNYSRSLSVSLKF